LGLTDELEWAVRTAELAERLGLLRLKDASRLMAAYLLEDDDGRRSLREDLDAVLGVGAPLMLSEKPVLAVPEPERSRGEIVLGRVCRAGVPLWEFGISREELNQHVLITARSGAGKTTLIMRIMLQLVELGVPFTALDFKRDYRHLVRLCPELLVVRWSDLRVNPLEPPPGVPFPEWRQQFLNVFGHVHGIWHGSTQYLLEAVDRAYEERGGVPRLSDVYRVVAASAERTRKLQEYASVVQTRLYGVISKLGPVFDSERTETDVEALLGLPVVLELDGLGRDEANLLALWLFYWIYAYRRARGERGRLLHVLIVDEAKRIFTASEQYSQTTSEYSGVPPADLICDEIRDFGEAIIAADQEPTKLSSSLKANTYVKLTGFLGSGRDVADVAEAMNLDDYGREAVSRLERGEWLVKLAGRYTKPFIVRSEDLPVRKDVSDGELRRLMGPRLRRLRKLGSGRAEAGTPFLSRDAWRLLLDVCAHPFCGLASRARRLGFSARRLERAKAELVGEGLVRQVDVPLRRGRPTAFLALTSRGVRFLEARGADVGLWRRVGRVGFEHALYQVLICVALRRLGWRARLEARVPGGRRVDVLAEKGGRLLGVEVELDAEGLEGKLECAGRLDALYVATRRGMEVEVEAKLTPLPGNVRVVSVDELLRTLGDVSAELCGIRRKMRKDSEKTPSVRKKAVVRVRRSVRRG